MDLGDEDGTLAEETDDWLWDLEERYDLGAAEDQFPTHLSSAADDPRLATVRRYRRNQNGPDGDGTGGGFWDDDRTGEVEAVGAGVAEPHHIPRTVPPRHRANRKVIVAAAVVVVGGIAILALATRHRGGSPNVAVATPTTVTTLVSPTSVFGPPSVATPITQPATSDTTAAPAPAPTPSPSGATPTPSASPIVFTPAATTGPAGPTRTTQPATHPTNPPVATPTTAPPPVTTPATTPTTPKPTTPPPTGPPVTTTPTTNPPPTVTTVCTFAC